MTALHSLCSVFDCYGVDIWSHLLTIAAKNTLRQKQESARADQTTDRSLSEVHNTLHNKHLQPLCFFWRLRITGRFFLPSSMNLGASWVMTNNFYKWCVTYGDVQLDHAPLLWEGVNCKLLLLLPRGECHWRAQSGEGQNGWTYLRSGRPQIERGTPQRSFLIFPAQDRGHKLLWVTEQINVVWPWVAPSLSLTTVCLQIKFSEGQM